MEDINKQLIALFDEMLEKVEMFNRHNYNELFLAAFKKYEAVLAEISEMCEDTPKAERGELIEKIASVIPEYAKGLPKDFPKKEKNKMEMNYNMNMAAYIIPAFTYSNDFYLQKIAHRMVEIWNERKINSLTLGYSTYEDIIKGFKYRLCYITTAVCKHQKKPDDCYELETLRSYRDNYLLKTESGRAIVENYYDIAPGLVMMINMQKNADEIYQHIYEEYLTPCINCIESEQKEECREIYMQMVQSLQKQYLYS